ncbi:pectin lyase-like protein [Pholiota conissans]|uniref:Pectinesterase n=1 Tax=Pholiota conissans TaxID=109636 RepID=A0A9P5Z905_9AGAR|nr:pectin lyase-like protein [Pholiota conissans]
MLALSLRVFISALFLGLLTSANPVHLERRASRTSPPSGAVVVRPSNPGAGEFTSIQAAVNSLPNDSSSRTIFIFPGTYSEQVVISRSGPLTIFGSTTDTTSYLHNTVTITHSESAGQSGSDPTSATLQVNKANFKLYNVNLKNTFGQSSTNGQALAVSASGTQQGYYGVSFTSFQDTVLAETGVQFYANSFIEGAVDFIFGQHGHAFFQNVTISSTSKGCITADGPSSSTDGIFVINKSNIVLSPSAASGTSGNVFLGRPWTDTARVVFTNSALGAHINPAGWSIWSTATPNTDKVLFAEFGNTGPGAAGTRASFSKKLTSTSGFTISDILGSNYATWVDTSFV